MSRLRLHPEHHLVGRIGWLSSKSSGAIDPACRNPTWAVSMSPSSACSQLHSRCNIQMSLLGASVASISGKAGAAARSPMYTQMMPLRSAVR